MATAREDIDKSEYKRQAVVNISWIPPFVLFIVVLLIVSNAVYNNILASDYDKVRRQIREFLDYDGPIVLNFNCYEYHTYDPKIVGWETPIEDMYPYLSDEEFKENMYIEPIGQERVYPKLIKNEIWD